jgi:catechol 2,3-dioxygenase-like lactoylglutathione lyase family enzyme
VPLAGAQAPANTGLPLPTLHHYHINSVDPERSLEWYARFWPKGKKTTFAGLPAFYDRIYLVYTKVPTRAPGGYDRALQRAVPQSALWTFGSTFKAPDSSALRERLRLADPEAFEPVTLFGGPGGASTAEHSWGLPMGHSISTLAQLAKIPSPAPAPSGQDYGYYIDPDGILVEFAVIAAAASDDFGGHSHFWHEQPLCAANWYVEHLGMQMAPVRDLATGQTVQRERWDPCDVPTSEVVTYASTMRNGQLRSPSSNVRFANSTWLSYPRQCRFGRCGPGGDRPLARSRGQALDHVAFTYPDLNAVIAHLQAKRVPIEGPYTLGDTRAVMIEDPDGLALELIEAK